MYLTPENEALYWGLDIETDDLNATLIHVCCVENLVTGEKKSFRNKKSFLKWKKDEYKFITHNGVSFDIIVLNKLWNAQIKLRNVVDTLVLSYLYNPKIKRPKDYIGDRGPHSLDCWGFRLGDFKIKFEDWSRFTPQMEEYCQQDVAVTLKLYRALRKKMLALGYSELSAFIEHRFRIIIDKQEENGFEFNRLKANLLYLRLRSLEKQVEAQLHEFFPPELVVDKVYTYKVKKDGSETANFLRHKENAPKLEFNKAGTKYRTFKYQHFNIGSPKQRTERLLSLGWKPTKFTPKGNPKTDEESVLDFAEIHPEVAPIADWLVYNGRANMIKTWLKELKPDGRIHGRVLSCGAGTRRCTHSSPNTANIPSVEARFGAECRACWTARPKRVLLGADASGLEGRVFIHYLASKEAEEFMLGTPHDDNAVAISKAVGFEVTRKTTKNLFYARLYGATNRKLGAMLGKGEAVGEKVRTAIDSNIPGFSALVESIEREYKENEGRIKTIDGGYVLCPSPHAALNYKFQSCGEINMKLAAILLDDRSREARLDVLKVGDIHDEWQFDCSQSDAEPLGELTKEVFIEAGEQLGMNIKIEGEYKIGRNWADTH